MKSGFPYLVDVKITERCPFGCKMCYQSSTNKGEDADEDYLRYYLPWALKEVGVFEVAFGGGEPTLYKGRNFPISFSQVLKQWKKNNFIVSFTTKNYNLYQLYDFGDIIQNTDSIAISVNSVDQLHKALKLKSLIDKLSEYSIKIYFQIIFGVPKYDEFMKMLEIIDYNPITLLGYKRFGFGINYKENIYPEDWLEHIKIRNKGSISADSVMINRYRDKLLEAGVLERWLVGKEGESTCLLYTSPSPRDS